MINFQYVRANDVADAGVFNPGGFDVSRVVADAHDATGKTVYVTVMGFAGNGTNAPASSSRWRNGSTWNPKKAQNGLINRIRRTHGISRSRRTGRKRQLS